MFQFDRSKEANYVGEFWSPDNNAKKFPGVITYSPSKGICLKIIGKTSFNEGFNRNESLVDNLFGFVEDLGIVTLVNCLPNGGNTRLGGKISYSVKIFHITYIIVGRHCLKEEKIFKGVSFHFPQLDYFCTPFAEDYFIADNTPLVECDLNENTRIKIYQGLKDSFFLSSVLHCQGDKYDADFLFDLKEKTKEITISKPFYCINVKSNEMNAGDYIKKIIEFEKLFSLFFMAPIISDYVSLKDEKESLLILKHIKEHEKPLHMFHLPINIHNIKDNLANVLKNWNEILNTDLLNVLVVDKFYNNVRSGYQQYCILVAIIGSWQVTHGTNQDYKKRYRNFLNENLQPIDNLNKELLQKLNELLGLSKNFDDLGWDIGEIRNCILHIDSITKSSEKYLKYKNILENEISISNLCETLFIILIKVVYEKLGIILSEDQKNNLLRCLRFWSSCSL